MTKSQIEYILALSKLKNFGKAAEACFISQSTLSAMIAKFENQAGVEIFNRKTRPISITANGEKILKVLRNIHREFHVLDETLNDINELELAELNIACIPTVAPYLYPLVLNKISEKFPSTNFIVHELTTENIINEIEAGNIDLGIVSIPLDNKSLVEYPIYEEDFLIYDCDEKRKSKRYKVSEIDLERLWLLEEGHCLRNQVGQICELRQQKKIIGNLTYSCGSIFTLIEMVKMNNGLTLLPRLAMVNNTQIDEKHVYKIVSPAPSRSIGLVTHKTFARKKLLSNLSAIIKSIVIDYLPQKNTTSIIKPF